MRILSIGFLIMMALGISSPARAEHDLPPARMVQIDKDTWINVRQSGHGPIAIVFEPGWTMSSAVFERQFSHFADSDRYTFISFDPRSQGYSTKTKIGNEYLQHGKDINALLNALGIRKAIIGGWSNGVFGATSYLNQFGSARIAGMVLIDGTPRCAGTDDVNQWVWYRYDDADQAKRGWTYGVMYDRKNLDTSFAQWMLENPTPDAVKWVSDISDQTPAEAAAMTNETCSYMNFESDVANFAKTSPLMITVREEVRGVASTWVQTNAPRANLHVLGKHMMFWEHADQFNQFLDQFLAQFH